MSKIFLNVTRFINEVAEGNRERCRESKDPLAFFDCVEEPGDSAGDFLKSLQPLGVKTEEWILATALVHKLLDRTGSFLGIFNVHRLMLTAVMLSVKLCRDRDVRGVPQALSEKTGVPVEDLVKMEKAFLSLLDWELHVTRTEYQRTSRALSMKHSAWRYRLLQPELTTQLMEEQWHSLLQPPVLE